MKRLRLLLASAAAVLAAVAIGVVPVAAQSVAQSYASDSALQPGMIVKLSKDKLKVEPVTLSDNDKMYGVVIRSNDAPLTLTDGEIPQAVFVVTNGKYQILVTDQNGGISKGDYLVISSVAGIGMKAVSGQRYIIGKALTSFDGKTKVLSTTKLKDAGGKERTINFGYVDADINVSRNPIAPPDDNNLPGFLRKASEAVSGKPVSPIRGYISLGVLLVTSIIVIVILYAGVRSSVISMGRNPLAKKTIVRNLLQVVLIGLIVLVLGLFAVYLLLKL